MKTTNFEQFNWSHNLFIQWALLQSTIDNSSPSEYRQSVQIIQCGELGVYFNIESQCSLASSSEAICPN